MWTDDDADLLPSTYLFLLAHSPHISLSVFGSLRDFDPDASEDTIPDVGEQGGPRHHDEGKSEGD